MMTEGFGEIIALVLKLMGLALIILLFCIIIGEIILLLSL